MCSERCHSRSSWSNAVISSVVINGVSVSLSWMRAAILQNCSLAASDIVP
jgi:hypothetical protein